MSSANAATGRAGRPRAMSESSLSTASALSPREQILDAAAALFAEAGFAGTSTRAIADRVGIRQQSLYYHFAGKDEILIELLAETVRPSIDFVAAIEARVPDDASAAAALFALASIDARTLRRTPHNIGTLYLLPEVQDARYDDFRQQRALLRATYGRLGQRAATPAVRASLDEARIGAILIQLAEIVIQLRRDGEPDAKDDETIAASCLRVLGVAADEIAAARRDAAEIIAAVEADRFANVAD
ncbi:helix-turn-helix domain-containing protein [Rathayibacter sp. YIM 133350]|uniref:TetR/AcrR family transcriptional regulator n=1 Tax=Rathayibacter sp. YIM 133350 TaxID=3131992 RepID=UPI00307FA7B6